MTEYDASVLPDYLLSYYSRLFPAGLFYRWLAYGDDRDNGHFSHREFSFNLTGDIYLRYLSFKNLAEFEKELKNKRPEKIDIGAVYTTKPKLKDSSAQAISKEFVLDIDLTDYDDVRTCCSGATVCMKCWKFIAIAVKILDAALRDDFGFKHLLWVFSGRRGVHCWVSDELARNMDVTARSAIIDYLNVIKGGEEKAKKVKLSTKFVHPSIIRAINIITPYFEEVCLEDQKLLDQDKNLEIIPFEYRKEVSEAKDRWKRIEYLVENKVSLGKLKDEMALQFCYPRLDVNVSKGVNHLLKAPFCIHPKSGKICVPFNPDEAFTFDIDKVPKITDILDEIGQYDKENETHKNLKDWKKTSIKPFMDIFSKFVKELENEHKIKAKAALLKNEPSVKQDLMDF